MKKRWVGTPDGTKDILFDRAKSLRGLEAALARHFEEAGFKEVRTPVMEYYELFSEAGLPIAEENMQKVFDRSGRIAVLRPDSTLPLARVAATQLAMEPLPLKLFYIQPVFRADVAHAGRGIEIMQAGIEYIGTSPCDAEIVELARKTMETLGLDGFHLEAGHAGLLPAIGNALGLTENDIEEVRELIGLKNFVALKSLMEKHPDPAASEALMSYIWVSGGEEVFDKLPGLLPEDGILRGLRDLAKMFPDLKIDFGLVGDLDYYTGLLLSGYAPGAADAILTGGRYDGLLGRFSKELPAVGFAVNLDAVLDIIANRPVGEGAR